MPKPINKEIYEKAKEIVYSQYKKPSAYRSGALQKKYKELGGTYEGDKKTGNLTKWFEEEWMDIGGYDYPVYRPTKRIDESTPLTVSEIDPVQAKEQIKLKQKIKGKKNLPPFEPVDGGRIDLSTIKKTAKITVKKIKKVFDKRKSGVLPPKLRSFLEKNGDTIVSEAVVVRCPLESAVKYLLSFISLGSYEKAVKQASYDKMFHLSLFINGKYVLDKQEVLKFVEGNPMKKDCESMKVDLKGKSITFRDLLEKSKTYMGDSKFTNYNAKSNNCQDFILSVLASNDVSSPPLISFIKQDADAVFDRLPSYTEKVATFFTDIGAVANKIIEGENIKVGGDFVEGDYQLIKNGDCWTVYNRLNQKIIEPCLPTEQKGTDLIKEMLKLDEVKELKDLAVKHRDLLRKDTLTKLKKINKSNNKEKSIMDTWREFYSKNTKGKKFGSRAEVNAHMKKLSAEYKAMKSK